jgi:methionyl-tRNA synthetase
LADEAGRISLDTATRLEEMDLSGALETIWEFVRRLNRYVEEQAPWKQAKAGDDALDATLYDLAEGLRLLSVLLYPFMPGTAGVMRERLGIAAAALRAADTGAHSSGPRTSGVGDSGVPAPSWDEAVWGRLPEGAVVVQGASLFPRIEE